MKTYELNGKHYPVLGAVKSDVLGIGVPLLDIPLMSDEQWRELAKEHPVSAED